MVINQSSRSVLAALQSVRPNCQYIVNEISTSQVVLIWLDHNQTCPTLSDLGF